MRRILISLFFYLFFIIFSSHCHAGVVSARLITDLTQAKPGSVIKAGVVLTMPKGWHIYGENPGDLGQPTAIKWQLPKGWTAGPIQWPPPIEFKVAGFKSVGYEKEVVLVADIMVPSTASGQSQISATVDWIACEDECIPEAVTLTESVIISADGTLHNPNWMPQQQGTETGLFKWIFGALIGGLILNLMPCVFPVLSLKILGFVKQSNASRLEIFYHGLMFSAGVMAMFLALAGTLVALRSSGLDIGWGFQLQSPMVVLTLMAVFIFLGIMMLGIIEVGTSLGRLQQLTVGKSGLGASFWNGVLAVIVATPCTAPFMGSAIGVALAQVGSVTWAVFISLGIGMSLPYLLLSAFPGWIRHLPKPGVWMVRMKQILAIPMFLTALWLGWVFFSQMGVVEYHSVSPINRFSEQRLTELIDQGNPVFVDVTASWCLTCQVNEKTVLNRTDIKALFKDKNISVLVADWTKKDAEITRYLATFNRSGVPVYILYLPGQSPQVLPSILTPEIIKSRLK